MEKPMTQAVPDVKSVLAGRLAGKKDSFKLAVVAEGGAMRGVNTAAACARLEAHGISPHVDMWIGTSSGGMNLAFAGAGMVRLGASTYPDALGPKGFYADGHSRKFINWGRLGREPVMDVAGLVDVVFDHVKPLDYHALKQSRVPVCVTATGRDGQLHVLRLDGKNRREIMAALKNTGRIPLIAHSTRDREVLWDGALSGHNMPVQVALEMGATHVVMLHAAPPRAEDKREWLERWLVGPLVRRNAPELFDAMVLRHMRQKVALTAASARLAVLRVAPAADELEMGEQDVGRMWRAAAKSWRLMGEILGLPEKELPAEWANAHAHL